MADRQDGESVVIGVWTEWRCAYCGKLQMKHVLPLGGIVETKCWNCKRTIRLELPFMPEGEVLRKEPRG